MQRFAVILSLLGIAAVVTLESQSGGDLNYAPKRINKMVELLEAG